MGFLLIKCILALSIAGAMYVSTPPYYPIEISRCLASNNNARNVVFTGILASSASMVWWNFDNNINALLVALLVITYFDDIEHWWMHMAGVGLLGVSATMAAMTSQQWKPLVVAAMLYTIRIVFKLLAMVILEGVRDPWKAPAAAFHIMYTGQCKHPETLMVFQVGGVLQWGAFIALSTLY